MLWWVSPFWLMEQVRLILSILTDMAWPSKTA
jgi:hypothetical protein